MTDLLWQISLVVSGGVDQVVLRGQTYTGDHYGTNWPSNTLFWYLFAYLYSKKLPCWDYAFFEALNYMGRTHYTQHREQPRIDVTVYNKDSAIHQIWTTARNESDLAKCGKSPFGLPFDSISNMNRVSHRYASHRTTSPFANNPFSSPVQRLYL